MSDYGHAFEPLMSGGCCASSTKRSSSAKSKAASGTKTKAKTATGSKAKTATRPKTAKAKTGGGFVEDLGKLAIPLALIAAKEGVQHMYAKKSSTAKKTTTTAAKKKTTTGRRVAVGGSGSDFPMTAPTVGQQTGGFYYNDSPIAQPNMPMSQSGGAAAARASRNAALSREFRNRARDIAQMFRADRKGGRN